jgi:signal-transduction protein with cAMP-binding, CBS, and nucleotidyltransferase domain
MPVGIVTDRNLVLRLIGKKKDPKKLAIREVMTKKPVVIEGDKGLFEAMHMFEEKIFAECRWSMSGAASRGYSPLRI